MCGHDDNAQLALNPWAHGGLLPTSLSLHSLRLHKFMSIGDTVLLSRHLVIIWHNSFFHTTLVNQRTFRVSTILTIRWPCEISARSLSMNIQIGHSFMVLVWSACCPGTTQSLFSSCWTKKHWTTVALLMCPDFACMFQEAYSVILVFSVEVSN